MSNEKYGKIKLFEGSIYSIINTYHGGVADVEAIDGKVRGT